MTFTILRKDLKSTPAWRIIQQGLPYTQAKAIVGSKAIKANYVIVADDRVRDYL